MAALAAVAAVGGTALQAAGHIMAGKEQARASEFEKQQLEVQAQQLRTASAQDEAKRRAELTSSLETIQAIRAGRGVGSGSPTGMAILKSAIETGETDVFTAKTNYLSKADLSRRASIMAGEKAKTSLLSGYLSAGADIASGVGKAAKIYG